MKNTLIAIIATILSIAAQRASAETIAPTLGASAVQPDSAFAALEGEWIYEKILSAGQTVPKEKFPFEVHFKSPNQMISKAITVGQTTGTDRTDDIVLDGSKKPAHLDISRLVRGEKQTTFAIYKIEGEILTICFSRGADRKPSTERPTSFEPDATTRSEILVLKRKPKAEK